jgi:prepilin-type N-terminal cleavage/methylation domain-containing protein
MNRNAGFTLIELLVVIAIIGILAGLAIPQFAEYRQRGFDAKARTDLKNVATAEEAYFADTEKYMSCTLASGVGTCQTLPGMDILSRGVDLEIVNNSNLNFTGTAHDGRGTGVTYRWNSANGGLQQ